PPRGAPRPRARDSPPGGWRGVVRGARLLRVRRPVRVHATPPDPARVLVPSADLSLPRPDLPSPVSDRSVPPPPALGRRPARLACTVPPTGTVLHQFDGQPASWRVEPLRVWSVKGEDSAASPAVHVDTSQEPKALFAAGMASFDRGDCPGARPYFQAIIDRS